MKEGKVKKLRICELLVRSLEAEKQMRKGSQKEARVGLVDEEVDTRERCGRRNLRVQRRGAKRYVESNRGKVWILPQEACEEITWRKEQQRRDQFALWEFPPKGPPPPRLIGMSKNVAGK